MGCYTGSTCFCSLSLSVSLVLFSFLIFFFFYVFFVFFSFLFSCFFFFFYCYGDHRDLRSCPARRSPDLGLALLLALLGVAGDDTDGHVSRHDPSWKGDRKKFCAALRDQHGVSYEALADHLEASGRIRPSEMTRGERERLWRSLPALVEAMAAIGMVIASRWSVASHEL